MSFNQLINKKKPKSISKYLVLKDLIEGIDVRAKVDFIYYLTSRIENIKSELVNEGIEFQEDVTKYTTYSHYKPYLLVPSISNIRRAEALLNRYETKEILEFLSNREVINNE